MKRYERLARIYQDADPDIKRLILHQMEADALDFEAEDCLAFLQGVAAREPIPLASQARRTLRRLMPSMYALRYRLRQPTSTAKAGTWTEYNIDRAEIDKLKRLGLAKTQDFTHIQMEQFVRSGLHLLSAPVSRVLERLGRYSDGGKGHGVACLSNLATPEAVEALVQIASVGVPQARLAAAALGDMRTDAAGQALGALFEAAKDPELAADAIAEMRNYPGPAARELVIAAADTGAPTVKIGACIALASFGKLGAAPVLAKMALDEEAPIARWAMDGLVRLGEPGVLPEIEHVWAESRDAWVRRLSVEAAGATRDKRAQEFVRRALASSDGEERAQAIEALIKVHVPERETFDLAFRLVGDPSPEVAVNALLAVAPVDTVLVHNRVRALLADPSWLARRYAVWCLGYVQGPASLSTLKTAIYHDKDERVVLGAVKAIAKYESADAAELLMGALRHQHKAVRQMAARVLGDIADKDVARKIFPRIAQVAGAETDGRVRAAMVRTLSRVGDPSQYLLISKWLKDPADEVVVAAIEGLDVLGSLDSIGLLEPFLQDARPAVRAQAALALWNQGEVRVAKKLAEGMDSGDEQIVTGSLMALSEILASLRRLEDATKYVLLFSELKANLKSPDFQAFDQKHKDLKMDPRASTSRVFDLFEFRTIVDLSQPMPAQSRVGAVAEGPSSPGIAPPPISRPTHRVEALAEPPPPVPAAPPSVAPMPPPDIEPLDPVGGIESIPLEPLETSLNNKPFQLEPQPVPDDDDLIGTARTGAENEIEDLLARVARGEGRAVLSRAFELAREEADPAAHLLAAQLLMEVAPADPREREATVSRAAEQLEKAIRAKPGRVEAHLRLAELTRDKDKPRAAKHVFEALRAAIALLGRQVELAEEAAGAGQLDDALALIGQLTRQLPLLTQANAIHGEVLYRRGAYEEAVDQLYLAHVADPTSIPLMLWLVRAAARAGRDAYARHLLVNLLERRDLEKDVADKARALLRKLA